MPGCEKLHASHLLFASPLASQSPMAKSPLGTTVPFFHFFYNLPWFFAGFCQDVFEVDLRKA